MSTLKVNQIQDASGGNSSTAEHWIKAEQKLGVVITAQIIL